MLRRILSGIKGGAADFVGLHDAFGNLLNPGSEVTAGMPANDPNTSLTFTDAQQMRGLLLTMQQQTQLISELLVEIRAQNIMIAESFEYQGGPEFARADANAAIN